MNAPIRDSRADQTRSLLSTEEPVWYVLRPEIRSGALRYAELRLLIEQEKLRIDDLIWHPGWEQWRPALEVPGLFPIALGDPVPAAPPRENAEASRPANAEPTKMQDLKTRAKHELRSYLIITAYTWSILSLLRLHETLIASAYGFDLKAQGWPIVTALILGKVVLIAEALRVGERVAIRMPGFAILIKSLFFAASILLFHAAEHVVTAWWHGEAITMGLSSLDGTNLKRSLMIAAIITIALIPYFLVKEIERRTGESDLLLLAIGLKR